MMGEINKRIKIYRRKKKFSQEELAEKLGIKTSTYSQMERSGHIRADILIKIADILKVDIRYFLYGDEFLHKENENEKATATPKIAEPEKTEPELDEPNAFLLDRREEYIITTYRNLNPKNKQEAYHLFMKHFNINEIIRKRRKEREKQKALKIIK